MTTGNYMRTALLLGLMTGLIVVCGNLLGGRAGMLIALAVAAVMNLGSYWFSDKIVLKMYRAQPVGPDQARPGREPEHRLVGVEADPALPAEVLRRKQLEVFGLPLELLSVVVEALEPWHYPATVGLEED